jgi:hypothetical protein
MATQTLNITNSQAVTISALASLASTSTATSSAIDNSTNKFLGALVQVSIRPNVTTSTTGYANVWLIRSVDGGTTYDSPGVLLGVIPMVSIANTTTVVSVFSTEALGQLGSSWKIAVENRTGQALNASSNLVQFAGIKFDVA